MAAGTQAQAGIDRDEFADLFDAHFPRIYAYLRRRLPSAIAEEMAAETFAVAFRERAKFDPELGDAKPWLFGIAANLMRHEWRRERRELRAYARTGRDPVLPDQDEIEERVDAQVRYRELAQSLADLPGKDREVLLLHAWGELSYEEIAQALRLPVGTVKSRLFRARGKLGRRVEKGSTFPLRQLPTEGVRDGRAD